MNIEIIRIYLKESEHHVNEVMKVLKEGTIKHGYVFRAIEGEGATSHLLGLSLDLPIVIEFFDSSEKIEKVLPKIQEIVEEGHVVKLSGELLS
jgi:PII-like signaling protein